MVRWMEIAVEPISVRGDCLEHVFEHYRCDLIAIWHADFHVTLPQQRENFACWP